MTAVCGPEDGLIDVAATLRAPGSAVLAVGADDDGDALALWHVSPTGSATGAWSLPLSDVFNSAGAARQFVTLLERRAITAMNPEDVGAVVERLSETAELDAGRWWELHVFSPIEAFGELVACREAYEATVLATKEAGKNVTLLDWARDFSADESPADFDALRVVSRLGVAVGPPVGSEVLTVARVLHWLVRVWAETEQVKNRRHYVRKAHGAPGALPPSWLAAVRTASTTRLPL